jgi:hypothetical protein
LFDEVDVPNLKPLPLEPLVHAEWLALPLATRPHTEMTDASLCACVTRNCCTALPSPKGHG